MEWKEVFLKEVVQAQAQALRHQPTITSNLKSPLSPDRHLASHGSQFVRRR